MVEVRLRQMETVRRGGCRVLLARWAGRTTAILCKEARHVPFHAHAVWRSGSHSLSFALGIVMLCGGAQAGQPESLAEGRRSLSRAAPGTLLDLNALFAEDDSCAMTMPRRSSYESVGASAVVRSEATPHDLSPRPRTTSGIRLVALETLYENS